MNDVYKFTESDLKLLNQLLLMKDLNEDDEYDKSVVVNAINSNRELEEDELTQVRNYVILKNLEYGFKNDEPNEFGYATEELADKLYDVLEAYY